MNKTPHADDLTKLKYKHFNEPTKQELSGK